VPSGRGKRVLVYTAALLLAPLPVMPFERGTREFALAVLACGTALSLASLYVACGEARLKARPLVGTKMLVASVITLLFGALMVIGSIAFLLTGKI
jgi:hypothetical protein